VLRLLFALAERLDRADVALVRLEVLLDLLPADLDRLDREPRVGPLALPRELVLERELLLLLLLRPDLDGITIPSSPCMLRC